MRWPVAMTRARRRWLPAFLVPLAVAITVLAGSLTAGATVSLPPKSASDILTMVARTEVRALSGTVVQEAALGLPEIPATGPGAAPGAAGALDLLTGSHEFRVFVDAPGKARFQVMERMAERDVVVNGRDIWFYDSGDNSATHLTLPQAGGHASHDPGDTVMETPESMADRFLAAIDPSTEVRVADDVSVAGRSAYQVTLIPRSAGTLVESVSIAVDSETGLPLRVEVRAKGQNEPAYSLAYTALDLAVPDPGLFLFTPPPGAAVTEQAVPAKPLPDKPVPALPSPGPDEPAPAQHGPGVTGRGWDAIAVFPAGVVPPEVAASPQLAQALQPVAGGRALTTALVNVLFLDDGRIYAGMVPLERLETAAAAE
ncbi:LolA family protein [Paenarthrobacter sp. NCHU4564]|uniref:LolA family protein n=1 Tax=Paenarthrobacter sp. NCHU4564 TaxID=3451353 RepID=UPI003F95F61C